MQLIGISLSDVKLNLSIEGNSKIPVPTSGSSSILYPRTNSLNNLEDAFNFPPPPAYDAVSGSERSGSTYLTKNSDFENSQSDTFGEAESSSDFESEEEMDISQTLERSHWRKNSNNVILFHLDLSRETDKEIPGEYLAPLHAPRFIIGQNSEDTYIEDNDIATPVSFFKFDSNRDELDETLWNGISANGASEN